MNINGMGGMQRPDAATMTNKIMTKKDSDGDGSLSMKELGVSEEKFATSDTNGDGLIGQDELLSRINNKMESGGGMMSIMSESGQMPDMNQLKSMMAQSGNGTGQTGQTGGDMISQLMNNLGVSEEDSNSLLEMFQNDRLDVVA